MLASQTDDSSSGSWDCEDCGEMMVGKVEVLLVLRGCGIAEHHGASGSSGDSGGSEGFEMKCLTVRGLMISRLSLGGWESQVSVVLRSTVAIGLMISSFEGRGELSGSSARCLGSISISISSSLSVSLSISRPMSDRAE